MSEAHAFPSRPLSKQFRNTNRRSTSRNEPRCAEGKTLTLDSQIGGRTTRNVRVFAAETERTHSSRKHDPNLDLGRRPVSSDGNDNEPDRGPWRTQWSVVQIWVSVDVSMR